MKKLAFNLIAIALVLGMAQCKKEQPQDPAQGEKVFITLDVNGNNGGTKVDVDTDFGTVEFGTGDSIYVGYNGAYVGTLTHNGQNFSGTITITQSGSQPLYFYFLGNVQLSRRLLPQQNNKIDWTPGETRFCGININDQSTGLPVISMGPSIDPVTRDTVNYDPGTSSYSAHLLNKCALVEFDLTNGTNEYVTVNGLYPFATVRFSDNDIITSTSSGPITLYADPNDNSRKWAILLPQDGVANPTVKVHGGYASTIAAIPTVSANDFIHGSDAVKITNTKLPDPQYVDMDFTVNGNGKKVRFSQGNLQYQGSTNTWRFAKYQWDYVSAVPGNTAPSETQTGWIDLFGWGTSGWNNGNIYYQPYSNPTYTGPYSEIAHGFGPTDGSCYTYDLTGIYANADWGVYNAIYNPQTNQTNAAGTWRTLTSEEWNYVLNTRTTPSNINYTKAQVNGVNGVILLPDEWQTTYYNLSSTNTANASYNSNIISVTDWQASLEPNGAVFLPAAGQRTQMKGRPTTVNNAGEVGWYWASSADNDDLYAAELDFSNGSVRVGLFFRCMANSVRLVKDVN